MHLIKPLALMVIVILGISTSAIGQDAARAYQNYQSIIAGEKTFDDLSPTEQAEVLWLMQKHKRTADRSFVGLSICLGSSGIGGQ